jgi:hypothetical protein
MIAEPLDPVILGPGLGDVGDAAVEERALAREPRIDEVGALVRGAAPLGGADHPALAHQLLLQLHVVEVAADGQPAVVARAARSRAPSISAERPCQVRPRGRGDLGVGRARQRVRPDRAEQAVVAQVVEHHPPELDARARRCPCELAAVGRSALVANAGIGDAEILPALSTVTEPLSPSRRIRALRWRAGAFCAEPDGAQEPTAEDVQGHGQSLLSKRRTDERFHCRRTPRQSNGPPADRADRPFGVSCAAGGLNR